MGDPDRDDRVLAGTRVLAAVIIPFLVVAFAVLFPVPSDTGHAFAWKITPTMSAMVLGSVYLGGAYFFYRVVRASRWHTVAGGFPAVGTFATLMGTATILHWDRFVHANVAFWLWVALYFTTPFLVFVVFGWNQRHYLPARRGELRISPLAAVLIVGAAVVAVGMGALLFLAPATAISIWPWSLTPLTARMLGAIFMLGLAGLGAVRERRWSADRVLLQVAGFMLLLILISAARAHRQFDTGNALTWLFAVGFVTTVVGGLVFYLRMERRARRAQR
jgi:hypothetical protein